MICTYVCMCVHTIEGAMALKVGSCKANAVDARFVVETNLLQSASWRCFLKYSPYLCLPCASRPCAWRSAISFHVCFTCRLPFSSLQ